jgi:hypothetical protein
VPRHSPATRAGVNSCSNARGRAKARNDSRASRAGIRDPGSELIIPLAAPESHRPARRVPLA